MRYLNDVYCKDCVGKVCKSKSSGDFKILKYNNKEKAGYRTKSVCENPYNTRYLLVL